MSATYNWRLPDDNQNEQVLTVEWTGPGWYITTRSFPGSEIYRTWKVGEESDEEMIDTVKRDKVSRSYGGSIRFLESNPDEQI